ncbi:MAG: hypothetical protein QF489_01455 [Planctomycetota bacterium]|nr:hypothetical protein [Planctomycetota bacterium]
MFQRDTGHPATVFAGEALHDRDPGTTLLLPVGLGTMGSWSSGFTAEA